MAVPDGWPSARVRAGAQNPAYRPARPSPASELHKRNRQRRLFGGPQERARRQSIRQPFAYPGKDRHEYASTTNTTHPSGVTETAIGCEPAAAKLAEPQQSERAAKADRSGRTPNSEPGMFAAADAAKSAPAKDAMADLLIGACLAAVPKSADTLALRQLLRAVVKRSTDSTCVPDSSDGQRPERFSGEARGGAARAGRW